MDSVTIVDKYASYLNKGFYCCKWCNKKFKTTNKFEKHVDEKHPFTTINASNRKIEFSLEDKVYLLGSLTQYYRILTTKVVNPELTTEEEITEAIRKYVECDFDPSKDSEPAVEFVRISSYLTPQTYQAENRRGFNVDNLRRMVKNHLTFQTRITEAIPASNLNNSSLLDMIVGNEENLVRALEEFNLFLNLGQPWRGGNFCPSLIIDLVWHASMLNFDRYRVLCEKFFGKGVIYPHCLEENQDQENKEDTKENIRYLEFESHFKNKYNRESLHVRELTLVKHNSEIGTLIIDKLSVKLIEDHKAKQEILRIQDEIRKEEKRIQDEKDEAMWKIRRAEYEAEAERQKVEFPRYTTLDKYYDSSC